MKDSLDILNVDINENVLRHDTLNILESNYICHHGVKGMHWGIRRYQPYPKSYKGEGKYIGKNSTNHPIDNADEYYAIKRLINNKYNVETRDDDMSPKERINTKLGKAIYFDNTSYWSENNKEYENCARFVNDAKKLIPKAVEKADDSFRKILTEEDKKKYKDVLKTYGNFDGLSVYSIADNEDEVRKNYTKSDVDKYSSLNNYMVFVPIGKEINDPYYKSSSAQVVIEFRNGKPKYEIQTGDSYGYPYADKEKQ